MDVLQVPAALQQAERLVWGLQRAGTGPGGWKGDSLGFRKAVESLGKSWLEVGTPLVNTLGVAYFFWKYILVKVS